MKFGAAGLLGLSALALVSFGSGAQAAANLIVNGDFEQVSIATSTQLARPSANVAGAVLTGWTNNGYNFYFTPGSADTTGSYSTEYQNTLKLWGANNGGVGPNYIPAASPTGGNFVGADGAYIVGSIDQTVTGLVVGQKYVLSFYWAAAQQAGFTGATTESWGVTFGSQTYNTVTVSTPSQGFTPWRQDTVTFTASATSQVLSFLAAGSPAGVPPFSLLDGVTLYAAPEPATWAVMIVGMVGITVLARRRRGSAKVSGAAQA